MSSKEFWSKPRRPTFREILGVLIAWSGLVLGTLVNHPVAVLLGGFLWVGPPTYWLVKWHNRVVGE